MGFKCLTALLLFMASFTAPAQQQTIPAAGPAEPKAQAAACKQIEWLLQDGLRGAIVETVQGTFHDEVDHLERTGCLVLVSGSWRELGNRQGPADLLFETLSAKGWRQGLYGGDSPDGTVFVLLKDELLCIVRGRWDGGDDTDPSHVPSDVYQVTVLCSTQQAQDKRRPR